MGLKNSLLKTSTIMDWKILNKEKGRILIRLIVEKKIYVVKTNNRK